MNKGIFIILKVLRVFQSFCRLRENATNFLGFRDVSLIFRFWGYFGNFIGFGDLLVTFRFWGYFHHSLGFRGILVIF